MKEYSYDAIPTFIFNSFCLKLLGRVVQSVGQLTRKSEVPGTIPGLATFVSPSSDSRGAVVSYWRKYVHEVLVNHLGGLSLPRKSVGRGMKPTTRTRAQNPLPEFFEVAVAVQTTVYSSLFKL